MSQALGDCPRLRGLVLVQRDPTGELSPAFRGPLRVFEHGREEFWSTFKGIFISSPPVGLNGHPLTVRPAHTSPWGSCVCWWCCSPCCWCRGFPKTSTAPRATAVLVGRRKLTGASSRLKVLDFDTVSRLGGTPTAGETNATPSSRVSTDNAENTARKSRPENNE